MSNVFPGGFMPPHHAARSSALRLANAWWNESGHRGLRFMPWDEVADFGHPEDHQHVVELVVDVVSDSVITVEGLVEWLPEDLRRSL